MKKAFYRNASVNKMYNSWAKDYDENNLLMFLEEQITRKLFNFKGKEILDLGCGTGRYAIPLAKRNKVIGVDFNESMLEKAKQKARKARVKIDFVKSDVTKFKISRKFDVILSMLVQDHIKDLNKAIKIIVSASKLGTQVFISNVHPSYTSEARKRGNKSNLYGNFLVNEFYHPLEEYKKLFGKSGFKLVDSKDIIFEKKYFNFIEFPRKEEMKNQALGVLYHFKKTR